MGFCVYFHKTWTPGYNSEVIDPNVAYRYQKKLDCLKKIAWWVFISTLIVSLIILLVTLFNRSKQEKGESSRCPRSDPLVNSCGPDAFVCNSDNTSSYQKECIHNYMVCDSIKDCKNGTDEAFCTAVSSSLSHVMMDRSNDTLEGYVLVRVKGSWHPYCTANWPMEMGEKICKFLGYNLLFELKTFKFQDLREQIEYGERYNSSDNEGDEFNKLWLLREDHSARLGPLKQAISESSAEDSPCTVGYVSCRM